MKKPIRISLIAAMLALASTAHADTDLSFNTVAGMSFTEFFSVTPAGPDLMALSVSGLQAQYSSLSFKFLDGSLVGQTFSASLIGGNWVAAFNDMRNKTLSLTGSTTYKLEIDGVTKQLIPGTFGIVGINVVNGTVTPPVPEPESYALLLAGLGLMGTIARRRSKSKAL